MRITVNHLRAKLDIINSMLGQEDLSWNTVGAVRLYQAYGATGVQRVMSTSGGVETLCELGTTREAARFLSGMIAALRITQDDRKAMNDIADVMSGQYWSPDTLEAIASYVRVSGRDVTDINA